MFASLVFKLLCVAPIWLQLAPPDVDGDGVDDTADVCSNTPPGAVVDPYGRPLADLDGDCDIDQRDFALFAVDYSGPCLPEICDGLDNECNGIPDDDAFSIDVENCSDGQDNDCDDLIDCADATACPADTPCAAGNRACNAFAFCDCANGFDNCNGLVEDGCETDLLSDVNHCLACDRPCVFDHATAACEEGNCVMGSCVSPYDDCNGLDDDGCEKRLRTLTDCGACNVACSLPNAFETCSIGICLIDSCESGWGHCDTQTSNGCERNLAVALTDCGQAPQITSICGDTSDDPVVTVGAGSSWRFEIVQECDGGFPPRSLGITVELQSPPGMNYDLYVYNPCGPLRGSSTNGVGLLDTVVYEWADSTGTNDGRNIFFEIRYVSGAGCSQWTLTVRNNSR